MDIQLCNTSSNCVLLQNSTNHFPRHLSTCFSYFFTHSSPSRVPPFVGLVGCWFCRMGVVATLLRLLGVRF